MIQFLYVQFRILLNLVIILLAIASVGNAQTTCIAVAPQVCEGQCVDVTYIGNNSPGATYSWTISCGTITNPTLQNPHTACFMQVGLCTITLVTQEPGSAPDTCEVTVNVMPLPQAQFRKDDTICVGECIPLQIVFTGTPPFAFQIEDSGGVSNYFIGTNFFSINICPTSTNKYTVISLADQNCPNTNPMASFVVTVLPELVGSIQQNNNELCAFPDSVNYEWHSCSLPTILSTQQCFSPNQSGCYYVVLDNGFCTDTVYIDFRCNLTCAFDFPDTITVGDSALFYFTGIGTPNTMFTWVLDVDSLKGLRYVGVDSLYIKYSVPGCYMITLTVRDGNCSETCTDTICVISKPCVCDNLPPNNRLRPIITANQDCCYNIRGEIESFQCFTKIEMILSSGNFGNVVAFTGNGWSTTSAGPQHIFFQHNSGFLPPGIINPGRFCVLNSGNYSITVNYILSAMGQQDTCSFLYHFDCPQPPYPPKCDSLFTFLERQHTLPQFCCFNIHTDNPSSNSYTQMQVTLSSGTFNTVQVNTSGGFILSSLNPQDFSVTHNSGFFPPGQYIPADFCVSGSTNPVLVTILYLFNTPTGPDTCVHRFLFDCEEPPDTEECCDSVQTFLFNLGLPSDCCFDFQATSTKSNCFSQICFQTSSGSFTNIIANPGWNTILTPQGFCFVPIGPFVATGNINPGSFCMTGNSNPFTIFIDYYDPAGNRLDSCTKRISKDCPDPPVVCKCDLLTSNVVSTSTMPGLCCYNIAANIPTGNCFTKMQVLLSSGSFTNTVPAVGYNLFSSSSQDFTLTHSSGFLPNGLINPATFCVSGSQFYTITIHYYFDNNGIQDTCTFIKTFDCPKPPDLCKCDSLTNQIVPISTMPGICCYDLSSNIPSGNCFTSIHVSVNSGTFTNVNPANGYNLGINTNQNFTLTHTTGFLPIGSINPATFCVTGSTLYTITIEYILNNNGILDTCTFFKIFDCPPAPDLCECDSLHSNIFPISALPGICCNDIQATIPTGNCFTGLQVLLSSGSFSNVQVATGYNLAVTNNQDISITHNSGFLPAGIINPATFCVIGSTMYTVTIHYFFNNGPIKDTCTFQRIFDCLPSQDTLCNRGACQNGSRVWQTLTTANMVFDMTVFDCKLIVAGAFQQIGNISANNIAAWDGTNWTPLGSGVNGVVRALAVHNGVLYVGGQFSSAGGNPNSNHIAAWNGSTWTNLDGGVTITNAPAYISSLLSTPTGLVAGGQFNLAGFTSLLNTNNIARWNGSAWNSNFNSIANPFNGPINSLRVYNNQLYAGGVFSTPQNNIAYYNGVNWLPLNSGVTLDVNNLGFGVAALQVYGSNLMVGGRYLNADGLLNTKHIALWNGTNWSALNGGDVQGSFEGIYDFKVYNSNLFAGGFYNMIGNQSIFSVAEWNSNTWSTTNHPYQIIRTLESFDACGQMACDLFAAGEGFVNRWACITSTDDVMKDLIIRVIPNPARNKIKVVFDEEMTTIIGRINITDIQGKLMQEIQLRNEHDIEVDITEYAAGIYILEWISENSASTQIKFVKM
ncbi:MAG: T9SS type A sorting domain-containing protein [Bacteroidota bacterium]|nr:T9SS type A sorting domain-containing protein [Bacteroidota bacterium]